MGATVSIPQGKLDGEQQPGLFVFKGIPFAAPPVGAFRWLPPQKPVSWTTTRDARRFGPVAHQNKMMLSPLTAFVIEGEQSEDCLTLNVWTPALDGKPRPVMVWIHGGAFTIGSGAQALYDGSVLARRGDVVVVTVNYRLGPLGFLRLADVTGGKIPSTGAEGMLDQVAALQWVRDNIAEFGGDPGNVTIFGESAGGMSVGTLLGMPSARGLFHKAIPQSGACHTCSPAARSNKVAELVLSKLNVRSSDIAGIRALTPVQLLTSTLLGEGSPDPELIMAYQPTIDGTHVPRVPIETVADGSASGVAVMVGSTLDEQKLFSMMDPGLPSLDRAGLGARVSRRLEANAADALIDSYEKARAHRGEDVKPSELFSAIETDRVFRIPGVRLAQTQRRHDPRVYSYLFTWPSPAMGGVLGSCHALELGFVFGTNGMPGMAAFSGSGPAAEKLATQMQDMWIAFARSGDPSCDSAGEWKRYDEAHRSTMVFGANTKLENAPRDEERRAWDAVPDSVLGSI